MPVNIESAGNFLIHDWAKGDILYNQVSPDLFKKMLSWCEKTVWVLAPNSNTSGVICDKFYKKKTLERLDQFRVKHSEWSECCTVNGIDVDTIDHYVESIDWEWLCNTTEWRFIHGDLHFDNTIYDPLTDKFTAIDWRTDFAGEMYGDLYYDLAKMLGGIYLNYKKVKNNELTYFEKDDHAEISIPSVDDADVYVEILKTWVEKQNLDWRKVRTLVPIIYLNMSPLHEAPFDKFLITLAQLMFKKL